MRGDGRAFRDYFVRRNLVGKQMGLLVGITVASCCIGVIAKEWATGNASFGMVVDYHVLRWGMGELLWCWLVADHVYSELGKARKEGRIRDWEMTPTAAGEIGRDFADVTFWFLVPSVLIFSLADALQPYAGTGLSFFEPDFPELPWVFRIGVPACMALAHLATVRLGVFALTEDAFRRVRPGVGGWAWGLGLLGLTLCAVTAASLFFGVVLLQLVSGPGPLLGGGLSMLRLPWGFPFFLIGVLAGEVVLKWMIAFVAARRVGRLQFPGSEGSVV